ncbi:MAG: winged helix-turn-helix transcriptional regulator [Pseudomonadota bacterium]
MDIKSFVNITSRAWALPILSSMHTGTPGRQAALITATGASRTAFAQSMDHLIQSGLLERNPGHGHPLRPEFRLTKLGIAAAEIAAKVGDVSGKDDQILLRKAWTLPVLTTLHKPNQFGQIKKSLASITDRALSQSLQTMEEKNWVQRQVDLTARPPRPIYCAINTGAAISKVTSQAISL